MSAQHTPGRCMQCQKVVGPLRTLNGNLPTRSMTLTHADPEGLFCTMRCAMRYGLAAARAAIAKAGGAS